MQLLHLREQVLAQADLGVVGGALVRVLAVFELEDLLVVAHHVLGEVAVGLAEPVGDHEVVVCRAVEGFGRQAAEGLDVELAVAGLHLGEQLIVVLVAGDHGDAGVVLGGGADHARAADVDVLDHDLILDPAPAGDLLERVEAAHDHVDGLDAVLPDGRHVLRYVAAREDPGHELGVHRLDAPVQHLREARDLFDEGDGILEQLRGAAGGDDGHAHVGETLGERLDAALVEHRDEGSLDLHWHTPSDGLTRRGAWMARPPAPVPCLRLAYKKGNTR